MNYSENIYLSIIPSDVAIRFGLNGYFLFSIGELTVAKYDG